MFRKHAAPLLRGRIRARRAACAVAQDELVETIRDSFGSCGEGCAQGQESGTRKLRRKRFGTKPGVTPIVLRFVA
jgi:hypothetical protein